MKVFVSGGVGKKQSRVKKVQEYIISRPAKTGNDLMSFISYRGSAFQVHVLFCDGSSEKCVQKYGIVSSLQSMRQA